MYNWKFRDLLQNFFWPFFASKICAVELDKKEDYSEYKEDR